MKIFTATSALLCLTIWALCPLWASDVSGGVTTSITQLNTYTPGTVASAGDVNQNFALLRDAVNDNDTRLDALAAGGVTSAHISNGAIATVDIADAAVTGAKIGSLTVATGNIADGAVTTAKIADSTITASDIANATITGAKIASATIAAGNIATGAVTSTGILDGTIATADVADGAVTTAKITDGTVASADIADATITAADIANATITGAKIASATVAAGNIATGAVTSAGILDGTIAAADIANATITGAKIASAAVTAANTLDEAGVAIWNSGSGTSWTLTTTQTELRSLSINAPAAGNLFVIATGYVRITTANYTGLVQVFLRDAGLVGWGSHVNVRGMVTSTEVNVPISLSFLYPVAAAGTYTYTLSGMIGSAGNVYCTLHNISIMYFPSRYE